MKKEHRELRRRPLLTPLWLSALAGIFFVAAVAWWVSNLTTTTVVVVRHAEKEFGTIEDPPLSTAGEQRAQQLARLFGERSGPGKIAAVFATETHRAQATAEPLASRLGLRPIVVAAKDSDELLRRIHADYRGRTVVVVGHANTVPEIVRRLSGAKEVPPMGEEEYSTVYIVTVPTLGRPSLLRMNY